MGAAAADTMGPSHVFISRAIIVATTLFTPTPGIIVFATPPPLIIYKHTFQVWQIYKSIYTVPSYSPPESTGQPMAFVFFDIMLGLYQITTERDIYM